jgi:hypothetical protein
MNWNSFFFLIYLFKIACQKKKNSMPAMVAHICNPSYLGDRDGKDGGLKPAVAKKVIRPSSQQKARRGNVCLSS